MRRVALVLAAMALALLLTSGVALAVNKIRTNGPDTLRGTNTGDNLLGEGGSDDLFRLGGTDNLLGGPGRDNVLGGNERRAAGGDKNLLGGPGNDRVLGGNRSANLLGGPGTDFVASEDDPDRVVGEVGRDLVDGGRGSDYVVGDAGIDALIDGPFRNERSQDLISGGEGNDIFFVFHKPAFGDLVSCGSDFDRVSADRKVTVAPDCERVVIVSTLAEEEEFAETVIPQQVDEFFQNIDDVLPPFPS
jgi:Ca2+-binding RTX toxin-like protein